MANITAQQIKELRDKTGVSIMECKGALTETSGDFTKAIEYLKHRGITLAEKKKDKATMSGRIGAYIHSNCKLGVLVEVAAETDFVANNDEFQELVKGVALQIAALNPVYVSRDDVPSEVIEKERNLYKQEILAQQKKEGKEKPPAVVDKIVDGKMDKLFYSQRCLLDQAYVKDEAVKISDLIKNKIAKFGENIVVKRFKRFELGKESL